VGMIERGELRLPEMQRRYVWRAPRVRDLVDSLYRGYPSGAILVWDTDEEVPLQEFGVEQASNPYLTTRLLLDGQQRLTSLSALIRGKPIQVRGRKRALDLLFNLDHPDEIADVLEVDEDATDDLPDEAEDSSEDELLQRFNRMTFVVSTQKLAAQPQWVSVSEVFRTDEDAPFLRRAGIEGFDDPRYTKYSQRLARLRGIRKYKYSMDVLERSLSYEEVTEIFVRVNSLGAKLKSSDLALAQITAKWRGALAIFQAFEKECDEQYFDLELGTHLKNLVVFATGQSRFLTVGKLPVEQLQEAWEECKKGMAFSLNFLRSNVGITSPVLLSSPFMVVALAYYGHHRGYTLSADEVDRVRYWVLIANAKGRYSRGSSETLLDQDLAIIRQGGGVDELIDRLRQQVGRLDIAPEELVGRNQRSAIFKTMFLAFRDAEAKDWHSGLTISLSHSGAQHKLQFHHIFPKAVLTASGYETREIDDIANLAFIGGSTNQKIGAKAPADYLSNLRSTAGDAAFLAQCVPLDDAFLTPDRYREFLQRRRELIADRLNAFIGSPSSPSTGSVVDPNLQHLDQRVTAIEVELRSLIATTFDGNGLKLPESIARGAADRAARAGHRDPSTLLSTTTLLEFTDLRDLEQLILTKSAWSFFEARFGNKQQLTNRFTQLAELRNVLRHARTLTDIVRKDGQAAIGWFSQALA
jgi:hypothetical protein